MITEGLIISYIFSAILCVIAYKLKSLPCMFISSLGWTISALMTWQQVEELLPMGLLFMLAAAQFFLVNPEAN